jgi:hypothetical protein
VGHELRLIAGRRFATGITALAQIARLEELTDTREPMAAFAG